MILTMNCYTYDQVHECLSVLANDDEWIFPQPEFYAEVLRWQMIRERNVKILKEIADKLDACHKDVNKAKFVGNAVSITAGIIGALAALALPSSESTSNGIAKLFILGGTALGLAGDVTTHGASIGEMLKVKILTQKAENLLKEEEQFNIEKHIKQASREAKALQKLFGDNVVGDAFKDAMTAVFNAVQNRNRGPDIARMIVKAGPFRNPNRVFHLVEIISASQCLINLFLKMKRKYENSPFIFDFVSLSVTVGLHLWKFKQCTNIYAFKKSIISEGQALEYSLLEASKVALNIVNLISVIDDIEEGSPSIFAKQIRDIKERMERELEYFTRLKSKRID